MTQLLKKSLIIIYILNNGYLLASQNIDLNIYIEPQITVTKENILNTNKTRFDLKTQTKHLDYSVSFDVLTYLGRKNWNMLDYIPKNINETIPAEIRPFYAISYDNDAKLHEAYVRFPGYADIKIGRQHVPLGSGYVWNPINVFDQKNIIDPTYELATHDVLSITVPLKERYSFSAIYGPKETEQNMWYGPENDREEETMIVRLKGYLLHFDYCLTGIRRKIITTDYKTFTQKEYDRDMIGLDYAGEWRGLGTWSEYAYHYINGREDIYEAVSGIDYTFSGGSYIMAEYFYTTEGKTNYKHYNLNDWMRFLSGETKAITRDQLYLYYVYPITDFINFSAASIISLNDKSMGIIPSLTYSISNNMEGSLFLNFSIGEEGTTNGKQLGNGILVRMGIYI